MTIEELVQEEEFYLAWLEELQREHIEAMENDEEYTTRRRA
jgi:hypothetical protein